MAADAYLKAAAGDLQKAAQEIKNQMNSMQSDFKMFERDATHFIDSQESDKRAIMTRMAANHDDTELIRALTHQLHQIQRAIDDKKSELKQRRSEMSQQVSAKEGALTDLSSEANTLARKAGDPALK
ncbi:MAG TPA: hypothetical protein VK983_02920 [Candidatus Limnocylindrales bacterium]|nr:hypothetical protein [Candidatus Limnocylindrales bacterium]